MSLNVCWFEISKFFKIAEVIKIEMGRYVLPLTGKYVLPQPKALQHAKIYHSLFHQQNALHVDVRSLHRVAHVELFPVLGLKDDLFHRQVLHASVSLDHLVYFGKASSRIALNGVSIVCPNSHLGRVLYVAELDNHVSHWAILNNFLGASCLVRLVLSEHLLCLLHLLLFLLGHVELRLVLLYSAALYLLIRLGPLVWREAVEKLYGQLSALYELLILLRLRVVVAEEVSVQQNTVRVHVYFNLKRVAVVLRPESGSRRATFTGTPVVHHLLAGGIARLEMLKVRLLLLADLLFFLARRGLMSEQAVWLLCLFGLLRLWRRLLWRLGKNLGRLVRFWLGLLARFKEEHNCVIHVTVGDFQELLGLNSAAASDLAERLDLLRRH